MTNLESHGHAVRVDENHPLNRGVLGYLGASERSAGRPLSAGPADVHDPYYELGTHPDIGQHLWEVLREALPEESRCVVLGSIALVHPSSGVVIAVGLGTTYALRLITPDGEAAPGQALGTPPGVALETAHRYATTGDVVDLADWGEDWYFGSFDSRERAWLALTHKQLSGGAD